MSIILILLAAYALLQVVCLSMELMLLRRPLGVRFPGLKAIYIFALVLGPTAMLLLATAAFCSGWKGEKGLGWWGVIHESWPGLMLLPLWLIAQGSLFISIIVPARLLRSKPNFVMMGTLAAICLWYAYSTLFERFTIEAGNDPLGNAMLAMVPLLPGVNILLIMVRVWRVGQLTGSWLPFAAVWATGAIASVTAKFVAAWHYYWTLPDNPPSCFVVTAAAKGHPWLVGRRGGAPGGATETAQLQRMRAFESLLRSRRPDLHARLRGVYDVVGPLVVSCIRWRLAADAMFVVLKPAEWAAVLCVKLAHVEGGAKGAVLQRRSSRCAADRCLRRRAGV